MCVDYAAPILDVANKYQDEIKDIPDHGYTSALAMSDLPAVYWSVPF